MASKIHTSLSYRVRYMGIWCWLEIIRYNFGARVLIKYIDIPEGHELRQYVNPVCVMLTLNIKRDDPDLEYYAEFYSVEQ